MKISQDEPILKFLFKNDFIHSNAIFFCQLHYDNVTSHSFLYSWKGSTCNYLGPYKQYAVISSGYILFLFNK